MTYPLSHIELTALPPALSEIPDPPATFTYRGVLPPEHLKLLTIVGSRKYTTYGKEILEHLVSGLAGYPVGIVSGLAHGIDGLAHEAALRHNLYTLAIPGSGLDDAVIYPQQNKKLARSILESGGGLLSEFPPDFSATPWSFPQRNRVVAGISNATLLIEASERSGTLITARLSVDYNRELLVVPGSIFSPTHQGIHQFLKLGATPVTAASDILDVLHIKAKTPATPVNPTLSSEETLIFELLSEPRSRDELGRLTKRDSTSINTLLMSMELRGIVTLSDNHYRRCQQ